MIKLISKSESLAIVNRYINKESIPEDEGLFITYDENKFIAIANECGDCYVEEFRLLDIALIYLLGNYESLELLMLLDETIEEDKVCYLSEEIEVTRGIRNKNTSKADELLISGFNKEKRPDLYKKYISQRIENLNKKME